MDSARQVVGNATAGMERTANAANGAIASIAGALGVQQLCRMVDEYAKFTSQLKLATTSQREYAAAYTDVKRIAMQSTQGLMETGILYARIANGTRELGIEQKKVSQIVETVNLALVVSGAAVQRRFGEISLFDLQQDRTLRLCISRNSWALSLRDYCYNHVSVFGPKFHVKQLTVPCACSK